MAGPKRDEPGYQEYREKYNARRRKRREDPAYKAMEEARKKASMKKLREKRRAEREQSE